MLNLLIISNSAREIYSSIKSQGLTIMAQRLKSVEQLKGINEIDRHDLAILDLDDDGWEEGLSHLRRHMPVIVISTSSISKAVNALKNGATDYLEKPLSQINWTGVLSGYESFGNGNNGLDEILGSSQRMKEIFTIIKKAASGESNVLITGESGTGKELVARAIHRFSFRRDKPFLTLNCSAIPDTLLEAELFGFERGSFTGAIHSKSGIFENAHGGTLFLDEIGDVSPLFQTKVLRVLQEGEFMRIGGIREIRVDVRLITATNKNLSDLISRGLFREDLYYRLNVINIHLPPLRNRKEDIPILVRHFLKKHGEKRRDLTVKGISEEAMTSLMGYSFPGNVRELENVIEQAISLAHGSEILPSDLPAFIYDKKPSFGRRVPKLRDAIVNAEKETILSALNESGWNISRASVLLGVYRQFLQKKIKNLSICSQ